MGRVGIFGGQLGFEEEGENVLLDSREMLARNLRFLFDLVVDWSKI